MIGIDKAISSSILISFKEDEINDIIFLNQPEGTLYPEDKLEENEKILFGPLGGACNKVLCKKWAAMRDLEEKLPPNCSFLRPASFMFQRFFITQILENGLPRYSGAY